MTRTLTAAVALATALGMAGLAHAQSSAGPSTSPSTMTNSTAPANQMPPPVNSSTQTGTQSPTTMPSRGTSPQASAPDQMNQGQTNQAQMGQPNKGQMNQGQMNQAQSGSMGGQEASQSQIQHAQQQLRAQGLYNGAIDGIVGPETQTALSQVQRQNGLPSTAQLDQQTLDRLSTGGANRTSGASTYTPPAGAMNPATSGQTGLPGAQPSTAPSMNR
jgi:hypothetical protein